MRYSMIGGTEVVLWQAEDGSSSGVLHKGDTEPVAPGAPVWADYEAWVSAGNELSGIVDAAPPPTLRDMRVAVTARLHEAVERALAPILCDYPPSEVTSWPVQWAEATQWLLDKATATPLIDSLRGEDDKVELCQRIIEKADAYSQASGAVFAWRRAVSAWIEVCEDPETLAACVPQYPQVPA